MSINMFCFLFIKLIRNKELSSIMKSSWKGWLTAETGSNWWFSHGRLVSKRSKFYQYRSEWSPEHWLDLCAKCWSGREWWPKWVLHRVAGGWLSCLLLIWRWWLCLDRLGRVNPCRLELVQHAKYRWIQSLLGVHRCGYLFWRCFVVCSIKFSIISKCFCYFVWFIKNFWSI